MVVPTTIINTVVTMTPRLGKSESSLSTSPNAIAPLIKPAKPMRNTYCHWTPDLYLQKNSSDFTSPIVPKNRPKIIMSISYPTRVSDQLNFLYAQKVNPR